MRTKDEVARLKKFLNRKMCKLYDPDNQIHTIYLFFCERIFWSRSEVRPVRG